MGALQQALLMATTAGSSYQAETITWENRIIALGGSVTTPEKDIADAFVVAAKADPSWTGLRLLYPLIGATTACARVPLIDKPNIGAATLGGSSPFTNSDVGTAVGVTNPTEKNAWIDTGISAFDINSSANCGMGFVSLNWGAGTNVEPIGAYGSADTERYVIDGRATLSRFRYGLPTASQVGPATTYGNGRWYGQRASSTDRKIYKNGSPLATATSAEGANGTDDLTQYFMGCHIAAGSTPFKDRCGAAWWTDASWTDAQVASFDVLLANLITACGR